MKPYVLSKKADNDLENIFEYTIQEFGTSQAKKYLNELLTLIFKVAKSEKKGENSSQIKEGLKFIRFQSHFIFYENRKDHIFIVRVLHRQMDIERHF